MQAGRQRWFGDQSAGRLAGDARRCIAGPRGFTRIGAAVRVRRRPRLVAGGPLAALVSPAVRLNFARPRAAPRSPLAAPAMVPAPVAAPQSPVWQAGFRRRSGAGRRAGRRRRRPGRPRWRCCVPLSGPNAELGKAMLDAAQLALFESGGDRLTLVPRDTGGTRRGRGQGGARR